MTNVQSPGRLLGIAIKEKKRGPMLEQQASSISLAAGLAGDYRGAKSKKRQVTLMTTEGWQSACEELQTALPWTTRRANLLVEGLVLKDTKGRRLAVGQAILEITSECDPCHRMDEAKVGLQDALKSHWRGGVTCTVVTPGDLQVGDSVSFLPEHG